MARLAEGEVMRNRVTKNAFLIQAGWLVIGVILFVLARDSSVDARGESVLSPGVLLFYLWLILEVPIGIATLIATAAWIQPDRPNE